MHYVKIVAYIRDLQLSAVEHALTSIGVKGYSFCRIKGVGEYANYYRPDHDVRHTRLEVIVPQTDANTVIQAIMDCASTGTKGDGLITVVPVIRIFRIRNQVELS